MVSNICSGNDIFIISSLNDIESSEFFKAFLFSMMLKIHRVMRVLSSLSFCNKTCGMAVYLQHYSFKMFLCLGWFRTNEVNILGSRDVIFGGIVSLDISNENV